MNTRPCWRNCGVAPEDDEVRRIDAMEDALAPLSADLKAIRRLITSLEMCHHKAERWVALIIQAIADGKTGKGPGKRPQGSQHPVEKDWQNCIRVLSAWCDGKPVPGGVRIGGVRAEDIAALLENPTALKQWQVRQVIAKLRTYTERGFRYVEIVENEDRFADAAELRRETMKAMIHDRVDSRPAEISLAAAIDHLEGCHWNFTGNLLIVMGAIGGNLSSSTPYATCGRNSRLNPLRTRMKEISGTLRSFWDDGCAAAHSDAPLSNVLGDRTPEKRWLAASLDKTIRSQFGL